MYRHTSKHGTVRAQRGCLFLVALTLITLALNVSIPQPARAGTFTNTGTMNQGRQHCTVTLLPNGKVLVTGGIYNNTAELYDPLSGTWKLTGNMVTNSGSIYSGSVYGRNFHSAVLLTNGQVLVMGGMEFDFGPALSSAELYNPTDDSWTATAEMSTPRYNPSSVRLPNGKVMVAGGGPGAELYDSTVGTWSQLGPTNVSHGGPAIPLHTGKVLFVGSSELFDPSNDSWATTGSPSPHHEGATVTLLANGKVLMAGGYDSAGAELYDPSTGTWTMTASMNLARHDHTATLLPNGSVLVTGGARFGPVDYIPQAELFDPTAQTWRLTGTQAEGRIWHSALLLTNQQVLVAGGEWLRSTAELYDSGNGDIKVTLLPTNAVTAGAQWQVNGEAFQNSDTILTNLPVSLNPSLTFKPIAGWVTPADQTLLISDNVTNTLVVQYTPVDATKPTLTITSPKPNQRWSNAVFTATAKVSDNVAVSNVFFRVNDGSWVPAKPSFTRTGALKDPRAGHAAFLLRNGKVLVIGGGAGAELYDPGTGAWIRIGSTNASHGSGPAFLLQNGKVLFIGSSELFDPAKGKWTPTGNLNPAELGLRQPAQQFSSVVKVIIGGGGGTYLRGEYSATLLANGKVLVAGGMMYGITPSAVLYDPATGQWTGTGSMNHERYQHAATLLPNGGVLVTGGFDYSHGAGTSGEIYDPATGSWTETYSPVVERKGHGTMLLPSGKVLLIGGEQPTNPALNTEIFDPATGTWSLIPVGVIPSVYSTITLLANGQILFTGDIHSTNGIPANANVFDPIQGVCSAVSPLIHARTGHTATLLADGRVLIAGGYNDDGNVVEAELYDPNKWAAQLSLQSGTNTIQAYAVDFSGNVSPTNTVNLNYILSDRLVLNTNGQGRISPNLNGTLLAIGRPYTITATPAKGFAFSHWTGSLTNTKAKLTFVMVSNLVLTANFRDSTRPVLVVTQPKANQKATNATFSAQGKASDNVGVSAVWCQLNGSGWNPAAMAVNGTNWSTPDFTLRSGPNLFQAYAVDAAGNASLTSSVKFSFLVQPGTDWAPDSLNGLLAQCTAIGLNQTNITSIGFDPSTFALSGTGTNSDDFGVGIYSYTKTSTNTARLQLAFTAPPALTNNSGEADFIFTNRYRGFFTNEDNSLTGVRFEIASNLLPVALAGKTLVMVEGGNGPTNTIKFLDNTHFKQPNPGTNANYGAYELKRYSPVSGTLTLNINSGPAAENKLLVQLSFTNSNTGNFLINSFDSTGTLQHDGSGKFKLP